MATVIGLTADRINALLAEKAATSHGTHVPAGGTEGQVVKIVGGVPAWAADATGGGGVSDGDKGDITISGSGTVYTIDNSAVTLAKMANVATSRFLGRVTAATGVVEALTGTQATTLLDVFTTALKGLVPASGGGTTNFLRADGTWATPPSTGVTIIQDENTTVASNVTQLDFQGAGVTASAGTGEVIITIPGGGSGVTVQDQNVQEGTSITTLDFQGAGVSVAVTGAEAVVTVPGGSGLADGDKGDITVSGTGSTWTIDNSVVTLAKMANVATARFLGRVTAATGVVEALTGTQATTLLDVFTTALKGLVPASGGGTTNFLRADGTWAAPAGSSSIPVSDEGSQITSAVTSFNFVGAGVTATGTGAVTVTVADPSGIIVQEDNVQEGATITTLDFQGAGVDVAVTGNEAVVTIAGGSALSDGDKGDITVSASGTVWNIDAGAVGTTEIADDAVTNAKIGPDAVTATEIQANAVGTTEIADSSVTNAKLANIATARLRGRVTAGTGVVEDLTGTQATSLLDTFTSGAKGLVPASGGGTTAFLRADGSFATPAGTGGDVNPFKGVWNLVAYSAGTPATGNLEVFGTLGSSSLALIANATDKNGRAMGAALLTGKISDEVVLRKTSDATKWVRGTIEANNTGTTQITIDWLERFVGSGGAPVTGDEVEVFLIPGSAAGSGGGTTWTESASNPPTGGADGDWHRSTTFYDPALWRKVAGTWERRGHISYLNAQRHPILANWAVHGKGFRDPGTAMSDLCSVIPSGTTRTGSNITLSNSSSSPAYYSGPAGNGFTGAIGAWFDCTVTALPSTGYIEFGMPTNIVNSLFINHFRVTSAGVASVVSNGNIVYTFATAANTATDIGDRFACLLIPGAHLFVQRDSSNMVVKDSILVPDDYASPTYTLGDYGPSPYFRGTASGTSGTLSLWGLGLVEA